MRQMCPERERLWAEYDKAIRLYVAAVREADDLVYAEVRSQIIEARVRMNSYRASIWQHCHEHGCDPDYVERFA